MHYESTNKDWNIETERYLLYKERVGVDFYWQWTINNFLWEWKSVYPPMDINVQDYQMNEWSEIIIRE